MHWDLPAWLAGWLLIVPPIDLPCAAPPASSSSRHCSANDGALAQVACSACGLVCVHTAKRGWARHAPPITSRRQ
jgi:hypothetical protein